MALIASVRERMLFYYALRYLHRSFFLMTLPHRVTFYARTAETSACEAHRCMNEALSVTDDHLYVMHQLCVIANNYLIPAVPLPSPVRPPPTPSVTLAVRIRRTGIHTVPS